MDFEPRSWTGEFRDPALEEGLREDAWPRAAWQLRMVVAVEGLLYLGAGALDWHWFGPGPRLALLGGLRALVGGLCLAAYLHSFRWTDWRKAEWFAWTTGLVVALTELLEYHFLTAASGASRLQEAPFLVVIHLVSYAAMPIRLNLLLGVNLAGSAAFLAFGLWEGVSGSPGFLALLLYFSLANGAGFAFRRAWNLALRREFELRGSLQREVRDRERAEQAARRAGEAKHRFAAAVSHEVRTTLNAVLGGARLLEGARLPPDQQRALAVVQEGGQQLARLLDDVLELARLESGRMDLRREPFEPAGILEAVRTVAWPLAEAKGLKLRVETEPGIPALEGDPIRIRQVLLHLTCNAVKYTPRGEVILGLALEGPAGAGRCRFEVRDTGPGFSAEELGRLFEPFQRREGGGFPIQEGAGLGLAISRELVAAMGGVLELHSEPGHGSAFAFTLALPLAQGRAEADPETPVERLTLLVVDDLEANRVVAEGLARSLGHQAKGASSAAEALALLKTEPFDAILADLQMPGMDGLGLLRALRALPDSRAASTPLFLSTAGDQGPLPEPPEGPDGLLPKPLTPARLAQALDRVRDLREREPILDRARTAALRRDLGPRAWALAVGSCRTSALASLEDLERPGERARALHKLAGLAASYGLTRLHREAQGDSPRTTEFRGLVLRSLEALEETAEQAPVPGA
ncbi:MAG: response regulator [Acidobacteria bacterium]|nr:response regulator [Acidobacteriota bacterium]